MKHLIEWVSLMVISLFIVACSEDDFGETGNKLSGKVSFDVNVQEVLAFEESNGGVSVADPIRTIAFKGMDKPMYARSVTVNAIQREMQFAHEDGSRGNMRTSASFFDSFGLLLYDYYSGSNWATEEPTITPEVYNEEVKRERGWMTQEYWPGSAHKLTFYAYAPYNDPNMTLSSNTQTGVPSLSYSVPLDCLDQQDLLICHDEKDVAGNYDAMYGISFEHVFAAIRFAIGVRMAPCHITRIELRNIYGEADYTFGDAAWTNITTKKTFFLDQDFEIKKTDQNRILTSGDNVFLMIPQTLPDDATLAITINDGEDHILEMELKGEQWKMGTTKTYYISTSATENYYVLSVTTPDDKTADGGNGSCVVSSYEQTFYGTQRPIPWTAEYEVNGVTYNVGTPDYLYEFTNSGVGSNTGETLPYKVDWLPPRSNRDNPHTAALQDATPLGSQANPYDLSAGKQTANCYVVNAPGTYSFPLVYGNARNADGSANVEAYGQDPNNPSSSFVDHANKAIDSPYIYETNGGANVPNHAIIVWQDAPTLVTPDSLRLSENGDSIIFTIEKSHICQGNCLIALRNSSNVIMWSWHIWVTDLLVDASNTIEFKNLGVGGDVTSHILPKPLGYCDEDDRGSLYREFTIRINQNVTGGQSASVSFMQEGKEYSLGKNTTYFQWGRKDPFVGGDGITNGTQKTLYDNWFNFVRQWAHVATNVAIQNPNRLYAYTSWDWSSVHAIDYWNVGLETENMNNERVKKSIYDPCPSGFCMPRSAAFSGVTTTGGYAEHPEVFNVTGSFNKGWNVNTNGSGAVTLFIPALGGYYDVSSNNYGKLNYLNEHAAIWTSGYAYPSSNANYANCFWFESYYLDPGSHATRSTGEIVYPVVDE